MAPSALSIRGACAELRLSRPGAGNALSADAVAELLDGLRAAEQDPGCRALVLSAEGPAFCTGVDLSAVDDPDAWPAEATAALMELLSGLAGSRLVTVAVVEGRVTGGGVGLAACCDFVVAGPGASFRLTELLLGLVPAVITPFVSARVGRAVLRMALLAEELDATAAQRLGLVDEVAERPGDAVRRIVLALRRMPRPDAVGEFKRCRRMLATEPDGYLEHAHRLFERAAADPAVRDRVRLLQREGML
ncbi:enoyl-CoA hydratase/isomerase family protein [Saccharopolyspora erythraea]|uniref:enoyl-CoA hydratase/isomerase family protein n=1 Tax=Saccharopolyspora erythraea TaxID=1836 RepID=UPI001BA4859F|nr:enoyl-CoA hydratase/isomerase family protein [Saccharopolyspora erythraea]QUH03654.1 enoyl-CoA hydratase/isomerase family protein [Saccharopolyspora erythraea]